MAKPQVDGQNPDQNIHARKNEVCGVHKQELQRSKLVHHSHCAILPFCSFDVDGRSVQMALERE